MSWTLAQVEPTKPPPTPQQREALRQGASLTVISVLIILAVGAFALVMLARYRRTVLERKGRKKKGALPTDAWKESARRVRIAGTDGGGADDDTVDIDPGDLSPDDVDDGDDPNGKGWR